MTLPVHEQRKGARSIQLQKVAERWRLQRPIRSTFPAYDVTSQLTYFRRVAELPVFRGDDSWRVWFRQCHTPSGAFHYLYTCAWMSWLLRAGLSVVPVVPWEGGLATRVPDQLANFYHAVLTFKRTGTFRNHKFRGWNITTTKKGRQLLEGRKVHHQGKSWLCVWEKGPRLMLVWGPRIVNPALWLLTQNTG